MAKSKSQQDRKAKGEVPFTPRLFYFLECDGNFWQLHDSRTGACVGIVNFIGEECYWLEYRLSIANPENRYLPFDQLLKFTASVPAEVLDWSGVLANVVKD